MKFARQHGTLFALLGTWILLVAILQFVSKGGFASLANFELIARQSAIVGMAAVGMTLIVISGAIDLSVGSVVAMVTVVAAKCIAGGIDPLLSAVIAVAAGCVIGLANGLLVTRLSVSPFIVTLGSLLIVRGAAKGLANEQKIDAPLTWLTQLLAKLPSHQKWMLLPIGVWMTVIVALLGGLLLRKTTFGRKIIAVGSNERATFYAGIDPKTVRLWVFSAAGVCAGLAGLLQFSRLTVGDPTVAVGLELDVIAAVVIGGASLSGGHGSITGSLIGAVMMATIRAGCSQMGLANWIQEIITGALIMTAVALDRARSTKESKSS